MFYNVEFYDISNDNMDLVHNGIMTHIEAFDYAENNKVAIVVIGEYTDDDVHDLTNEERGLGE